MVRHVSRWHRATRAPKAKEAPTLDAAEWINDDVAREMPQELTLAIVGERGFDLDPEDIEDHLRPYVLDLGSEDQA